MEKPKRVVTPDDIRNLRCRIVRFRFAAEEAGLWPGSGLHSHALCVWEWEAANDALIQLVRVGEACNALYGPPGPRRLEEDIPDVGWSAPWAVELRRAIRHLTVALQTQLACWYFEASAGGPGDMEECQEWLVENAVLSADGVTARKLEPVDAAVAAVLDLCVRRLDEILAHGVDTAEVPFVPTPLQRRVLDALKGRSLTKDALAAELGVDPSQLHRDALRQLMDTGVELVCNKLRGVGYYRPDAPPPGSALLRPRRVAG